MLQRIPHYVNVLPFLFLLLVLGFMSSFVTGSASAAGTITVDEKGGSDFTTIQEAINASEDGDTIQVMEGAYQEHIIVTTSLTIVGSGSSTCIIDAGGDGIALMVENTNVTIRGFTFTGGGCCKGAGLQVKNSEATISDITCTGNLMGGLHLINTTVNVTNSTFWNNTYGILTFLLHDSIITNCSLDGNWVGLYLTQSFDNQVADLSVSNSTHLGMSIIDSGSTTIERCLIYDNPYGIGLSYSADTLIKDSIIANNTNGIFLMDPCPGTRITGCVLQGNKEFGIDSTQAGDLEVNATGNWWGDDTGPYHRWLHPGGGGDTFAGNVTFYPWNGTLFMEPRIDIGGPGNGTVVKGTVTIFGTAEDPDGGIVETQLSFNGTGWMNVSSPGEPMEWEYLWNTTHLSNGTHTLWFRAFDGTYYSAIVALNYVVANDPHDGEDGNGSNGNGNAGNEGDENGSDRRIVRWPVIEDFWYKVAGLCTIMILLVIFLSVILSIENRKHDR